MKKKTIGLASIVVLLLALGYIISNFLKVLEIETFDFEEDVDSEEEQ